MKVNKNIFLGIVWGVAGSTGELLLTFYKGFLKFKDVLDLYTGENL